MLFRKFIKNSSTKLINETQFQLLTTEVPLYICRVS